MTAKTQNEAPSGQSLCWSTFLFRFQFGPGPAEANRSDTGRGKFDVIHFNNGMHGRQHTEEEYQKAFPEFSNTIQRCAPKAKLIHVNNVHFNPQGIELQAAQVAARVEAMLPAR